MLDEIGPGWTRDELDSQLIPAQGAAREFSSADGTLLLLAQPLLDCTTGFTGRSSQLAFVRSLQFEEAPADTSGIAHFITDSSEAPGAAALFSTARFAFLVVMFANDDGAAVGQIVDSVVARQAARDGGIVIESAPPTSRLDDIIVATPPVSGLGSRVDYTTDLFACEQALSGESDGGDPKLLRRADTIVSFLSTHSTERLRAWVEPSTGSFVAVQLTDYPYDLFAGIAAGGALSAQFQPMPIDGVDGLDQVPGVRAWQVVADQPQYFARFRRGTIVALITVAGMSDTDALDTLSALTRAQFVRMPNGSTSALTAPSAAKSVATSGSLIALIGVGVLGVRRARAGRVVRTVVRRDELRSFDVSRRASELRRRGLVLGATQVACVVVILVFLASDFGWIRLVGAAATVLLGIVATSLWRRKEARVLGVTSAERVQPRPSFRSAALTIAALTLLACGGGLVVWGLRETLFVPSLTHLRLSDWVSIEPRLLAWSMVAIGLLLIVIDSFVLRAARAVARIGWREWTDTAPPIVYLRSFEDDEVQLANVLSARRPFLEFFTLRGRDAFEESVAWELSCYGPVLAIARPGHRHVSLGAARMHLSDDEWRSVISEQIAEARAVAITIGRTPGLAWEISHIVQSGNLGKTLFVVPPVDPAEIQLRWDFLADTLTAAGAGRHTIPADPACLVVVKVFGVDGPTTAYCADRRDEATYRAAVTAVLA